MPETFTADQQSALDNLGLMRSAGEERFDRITRMARDAFGVSLAMVNLLDADVLFTKSPQNDGVVPVVSRAGTFCSVAIAQPDMLVVEDATNDERFSQSSAVQADGIRFYAGRPVATDGQLIGTLCLLDTEPREFDTGQRLLLEEMALWVERELQSTADRDRDSALQRKLLPRSVELEGGFSIAGMNQPFHHVGGDFYSWTATGSTLDITLADVMGKGIGAAILAATVRAGFLAHGGRAPEDTMRETNLLLFDDFSATETFATAFHARLDVATAELSYVDAGHGLSIIVKATGAYSRLSSRELPLGVARYVTWSPSRVTLQEGDTLLTFSDGLLDLFDGSLASLDKVAKLVWSCKDVQSILSRIRDLAATDAAADDITVVALRRD